MEMPDKHIQNILNSAKPEYDAKFWDSANVYIQQKKRKRRLALFFWSSGLSLGIVGFLMMINLFRATSLDETIPEIKETPSQSPYFEHENTPIAHNSSAAKDILGNTLNNTANSVLSSDLSPVRQNYNQVHVINNVHNQLGETIVQSVLDSFKSDSYVVTPNDIAIHTTNELPPSLPILLIDEIAGGISPTEHQTTISRADALEVNLSPLEMNEITLDFSDHKVSIKKQKDKLKYTGFLSSSAIFNPAWDDNQLFGMGFSVGGGLEVKYARYLFGRIGLSYLHRWGTFNVMIDHPTPQYGFVKDDKGYSLVPTDASYAELPLQVGMRYNRIGLGFGVSVTRLLGAKGEVFSYQGELNETIPGAVVYRSSPVSSGWIETPGFRNWIVGMDAFLEFKLQSSLFMGCNFRVLPGGLVKEDYQYKYQNETGNYERIKTAGLLENRYHLSIFLKYTL
jgi:hypothetical protein